MSLNKPNNTSVIITLAATLRSNIHDALHQSMLEVNINDSCFIANYWHPRLLSTA